MKINKIAIGGMLILVAVIYLISTATADSLEYFMTVDELHASRDSVGDRSLRVSGAVVGDTIQYDPQTLTLTFEVANVPADTVEIDAQGGLAEVLHQAVIDPTRTRIQVVYVGPKPDLMKNEAQAIMTGQLDQNGVFQADELLLKCPTRYEEAVPEQAEQAANN